ncbi:MAG TPA: c-type cytochrome [Acidobacteriaceae bacterium]|nr:c-type cytochrome [Acidobacteriaceae bacterium]
MKRLAWLSASLILAVYLLAIMLGLRTRDLSWVSGSKAPVLQSMWTPPPRGTIPPDHTGDLIRFGEQIFNDTRLYVPAHARAAVSCSDCHAAGGIQPFASPVVGLPALFPMYNQRAGHVISLKDRIQECFVRSENGTPLNYEGPEMNAIVAYINWLSQPRPNEQRFIGRGLVSLPSLAPDPVHGESIYASQCAGCHGAHGEGLPPQFPPLWGPSAFNDGAGMNGIPKMAAFVQHNMPQNRMGILSAQDAYDVAAFIHQQPRPAFNKAYAHF